MALIGHRTGNVDVGAARAIRRKHERTNMLDGYRNRISEALQARRRIDMPPLRGVATLVAAGFVAYLLLSLSIVPPGSARDYNFTSEEGTITVLSGIALAFASAFAAIAAFLTPAARTAHLRFWLLVALGMGFLSFDELLGFHERLGEFMAKRDVSSGAFRNWNDIMVIGYGVVAVPAALYFLPVLLRYPRMPGLLALAFGLYAMHTLIDSVTEQPSVASRVVEESFKLGCGLTLAFAIFCGMLAVIREGSAGAARGVASIPGATAAAR
jgi:hypothetical protein